MKKIIKAFALITLLNTISKMKKEKVLEQEQKSKLKPFSFVENDGYLLLLKNGLCITARWSCGHFNDDTTETCIEEEIESIVSLKDLGLWRTKKNMIWTH